MPNFFDPNETTVITFDPDTGRPPEQRRRVECRFITMRERRRIGTLADKASTVKDEAEQDAILSEILSIGVVGPVDAKDRNGAAVPKTIDGMQDVFSDAELWIFAKNYPAWIFNSEVDPKK